MNVHDIKDLIESIMIGESEGSITYTVDVPKSSSNWFKMVSRTFSGTRQEIYDAISKEMSNIYNSVSTYKGVVAREDKNSVKYGEAKHELDKYKEMIKIWKTIQKKFSKKYPRDSGKT
jgi:hypothetical protein